MSSRRSRKRSGRSERKWIGRAGAIVSVSLLAVLVGGYIGVRKYLHSEGFRRLLSEQVSRTLGAPGSFQPFRWDGLQVDTAGFEAAGESQIKHFRADDLHTEIGLSKVTSGVWQLKATKVGRVDLIVDLRESAPQRHEVPPPVNEEKSEAQKNGWLPSEVAIDGLVIQQLSAKAMVRQGEVSLAGTTVKVEPDGANAYVIRVDGGEVLLPWGVIPRIAIDHLVMRQYKKDVFLREAKLAVGSKGTLTADGEWDGRARRHSFTGQVVDLDCAELLDEDWAKRLTGMVDSTFVSSGDSLGTRASGTLTLKGGTLTALPFLESLSAYADTRRFRVLPLNEARTDWSWVNGITRLDNLVLSSEGLIRLEGDVVITGETIDGRFRLGLAPGTLAHIPGAETAVFLPGESGLLWTTLHILGPLDHPSEDLSERLLLAAGDRMLENLPETGVKVLKHTQKIAAEVPGKVLEESGKALEQGVKVVEKAEGVLNQVNDALGSFLGGSAPVAPVPPPVSPPEPPKSGQPSQSDKP